MAIARPVRALGLAAVLMWCFFLYTILKPSPGLHGPGGSVRGGYERDPNLDRMPTPSLFRASPLRPIPNADAGQQPQESQKANYGGPRTTMRRTLSTRRESTPPFWPWCETKSWKACCNPCATLSGRGTTSSTIRGLFSTTSPSTRSLRGRLERPPTPSADMVC